MAYTLTADQITDMQGDLGITNDQTVFTDAELQRFYVRAEGSYPKAMVFALRQLLANKAKLRDYGTGLSYEKESQVYDHVKGLLSVWQAEDDSEDAGGGNQVKVVGVRLQPRRDRDKPDTGSREEPLAPHNELYR